MASARRFFVQQRSCIAEVSNVCVFSSANFTRLKIRLILFSVLCFTMADCFAQASSSLRILRADGAPVPGAAVQVRSARGGALHQTYIADSSGAVILPAAPDSLWLDISAPGLERISRHIVTGQPVKVILNAGRQLDGVVVARKKKLIESITGGFVFNVEGSIAASGNDTYEALKRVPGVQVGMGSVGIAGKSTVIVTINDRRLQLTGDELESYLRSIPANELSKIEIITAPPARYDAEGNAGIINIVTKKVKDEGLNGTAGLAYQQRTMPSYRADGRLNYKKGPLTFSLSANAADYRFLSDLSTTAFHPDQRQEQRALQLSTPFYFRNQLEVDYSLGKTQTISGQYSHNISNRGIRQSYQLDFLRNGRQRADSVISSDVRIGEFTPRDVAGIYYEWRIDSTGKKLNVDLDYFSRRSDQQRDFTTRLTDAAPGTDPVNNLTHNKEEHGIRSVKADLILPAKDITATLGVKALFINSVSDYSYGRFYGNAFVRDTLQSDYFTYTERTQAIYGSLQGKRGAWQLQAGLRVEATQTTGTSELAGHIFSNDYLRLFPSAFIRYKPSDDAVAVLSYSRRIERPQFSSLNPFRKYITANSYEAGNPYLQPSLCHDVTFSFIYRSAYTISLFRQYISDYAGAAPVIDTVNHTFINTTANIGSVIYYGINLSVNKSILKRWELTLQLHGNYQQVRAAFYGAAGTYAKPFCSMEMVNSFSLDKKKKWMVELGFNGASDQVSGVSIRKAYFELYGGLKYVCFDKRMTISATMTDILKTSRLRQVNIYNGAVQDDYYDSRALFMSVSWKFGQNSAKGKRTDIRQEDIQRAE